MNEIFLSIPGGNLQELGGFNTAKEISGQPFLWRKTLEVFQSNRNELARFLERFTSHKDKEVIFTGAGTSAFIGDALAPVFEKNSGIISKSIPTTDIVTHPKYYFHENSPTLLVSFARSGNSPESIKSVQLASKFINNVFHLIITCNKEGALSQLAGTLPNSFLFLLPEESNDKSLAMTGSFSSMLLAGILISLIDKDVDFENEVEKMSRYGTKILTDYLSPISRIAELDFNRAVFLGSGPFGGVARESHLKLQELTDGNVICKFDSFLGFRHGPKAVMNAQTLISFIFSNNEYSQKYERDLVNSIESGKTAAYKIGIMENDILDVEVDLKIILNERGENIIEVFLLPVSVLPAQLLGFFKSINLGLKPDSPSESGLISRVVEGVNLYEYVG